MHLEMWSMLVLRYEVGFLARHAWLKYSLSKIGSDLLHRQLRSTLVVVYLVWSKCSVARNDLDLLQA
jgi:hypothetical protein